MSRNISGRQAIHVGWPKSRWRLRGISPAHVVHPCPLRFPPQMNPSSLTFSFIEFDSIYLGFSFLFNWNCCGFYVFFCWSESSLWFSGLYESCVGQWILVKAKNMTQNRDEPPAVRVYTICDESRLVCIIIWDCSWDESNSYEYFNPNHLNSFNTSSLYRYLIVRNVPALGCGDDLLNLFASYGDIEE